MVLDRAVQSTVLLIVDGLRPSALGPYGNTWFDTPSFNRLASQSLLFEQCITDSPDPQSGLRSVLTGQHCLSTNAYYSNPFQSFSEGGADTIFVTVAGQATYERDGFDRVVEIDLPKNSGLSTDFSETELSHFFATVIQVIREIEEPSVLVINCPGMSASWDAPVAIREELSDEEDPEPKRFYQPPSMQFNEATDDPDQLFGFQVAYGAQVVVLDRLLGLFLEELEQHPQFAKALFCLTATRSFPLGEHGVVGHYRELLHSEMVHVPAMIRFPSQPIAGRSQQLIQPGSILSSIGRWQIGTATDKSSFPTINETKWLARKKTEWLVSQCRLGDNDVHALQTQAWKFISGPSKKLYVRPDDIWEFNDTSALCLRVAEQMQRVLEEVLEQLSNGDAPEFQLPDALAYGVE